MCSVFEKDSVVRGHCMYKMCWTPVIGEEVHVTIMTEDDEEHDEHVVNVRKDGYTVGYMCMCQV